MSGSRLPLPLFIAQRYLRSSRRNAFVTFLSLTAAGGIALGVAALILSTAALSGFQQVLRQEMMARTAHVEITLPAAIDPDQVVERLSGAPAVESVRLVVQGKGWLAAAGRARPVELIGFEGAPPSQFPAATGHGTGLYVSRRLAETWGLVAGEYVEVVSARPTLTPLGPQPRVRRLTLAGTFEAGRAEQEERVALPLADAERLFGKGDRKLLLTCVDSRQAIEVARELQAELPPGAVVKTWRDLNRALLFLLRLEKSVMFVAVFLIVVVAAMAIVSDLMLILTHKQAELGILGAMGARPTILRRIFLWLGALLVAVGAGLGSILGVAGAYLLDRYHLLGLPGDVYFLDHVPFLIRPGEVFVIVAATLLLSLACAWIAAARASALRPVEALRR